jgi:undecaprenyl diphosphate synthase
MDPARIHDITRHSQEAMESGLSKENPYTPEQISSLGLLPERLPRHVAIIMDGNGRWAQSHGMPRIEGHRRGVNSVRAVVEESSRLGLEQLTLYCFSSENWKRPPTELNLLMRLLRHYLVEEREEIHAQGLQFCTIGDIAELSPIIQEEIHQTTERTQNNTGMRLCLAINYGSRSEICGAVREIAAAVRDGEVNAAEIDETLISSKLMTAGMPDPDLVIRTASEFRVSNFLLWQISYAELYICEKRWPEFRELDLHEAIKSYAERDRRFGGLNK